MATGQLVKESNGKYVITFDGVKIVSSHSKAATIARLGTTAKSIKYKVTDFIDLTDEKDEVRGGKIQLKEQRFSIDQRFTFMEQLVNMVVGGTMKSLIITGEPGTGKTFTVTKQLEKAGMLPPRDYAVIKGFSTPKAMYRALFENQDKLVIFDDCDSILKDLTALNILKAALDSYGKRTISWLTERESEDLPTSFEFKGQVLFISNLPLDRMNSAIMSRAFTVDVSMTMNEKVERMRKILPDINCDLSEGDKEECLDLLVELQDDAIEFNLRTLLKVMTVRTGLGKVAGWKDLASYAVAG
jgi:hypothetical protein